MIQIAKRPATPPTLLSTKVAETKQNLVDLYQQGKTPSEKDFPSLWGNDHFWHFFSPVALKHLSGEFWLSPFVSALEGKLFETSEALKEQLARLGLTPTEAQEKTLLAATTYTVPRLLWDHQHGKCCYCESQISHWKQIPDVEHFRPKGGVSEDPNHPGYWWLAYEWSNFFLACKTCNSTYKSSRFPLIDPETRLRTPSDTHLEQPVLIHPIEEDPELFFEYQRVGTSPVACPKKDDPARARQAKLMLPLTAINDIAVRTKRETDWAKLIKLRALVEKSLGNPETEAPSLELLREVVSGNAPFAGMARDFFRQCGLLELLPEFRKPSQEP